jgi:hypothetical protein
MIPRGPGLMQTVSGKTAGAKRRDETGSRAARQQRRDTPVFVSTPNRPRAFLTSGIGNSYAQVRRPMIPQ